MVQKSFIKKTHVVIYESLMKHMGNAPDINCWKDFWTFHPRLLTGDVYLCFEGGPGVSEEARVAFGRGDDELGHTSIRWMLQKSGNHQLRLVGSWNPICLQGFGTSQVVQDFVHQQVCHQYLSFICWEMTKNGVKCDTIWHSPQLTPGARVVPLAFLGGASGGDFGFPQQAFETPPWSLGYWGSSGLLVACLPVCCWRWIIIYVYINIYIFMHII